MLQLFGYWRSSASFRVRLVLQLKGLDYEQHPVNLRQGEQKEKAYRRVNPQGLVPFLIDGDVQLGQSVAIMEYLDETYPAYPLMPSAPEERARVRQIVNMIACDIHPLNNLRVLNYLVQTLKVDEAGKNAWYSHWARSGLEAFERQLVLLAQQRAARDLEILGVVPVPGDAEDVDVVEGDLEFDLGAGFMHWGKAPSRGAAAPPPGRAVRPPAAGPRRGTGNAARPRP